MFRCRTNTLVDAVLNMRLLITYRNQGMVVMKWLLSKHGTCSISEVEKSQMDAINIELHTNGRDKLCMKNGNVVK